MILFRSAKESDLQGIYQLTRKNVIGITTIPKKKKLLNTRLQWAVESFDKKIKKPNKEYYLFVLEDQGKIIGISAIEAKMANETPFYSYRISRRSHISHALNIRCDHQILTLVNDYQDCTELCTLYLHPEYRHAHNGLLLSKGRLLFMAQHPERFEKTVLAELRGYSNEQGKSPFWQQVGRHFFKMTYEQADKLSLETNKQFITDLMGQNSIYVELLSPKARSVIGKPHPNTLPALNMLLKEGFTFKNHVDIFDAGPIVDAPFSEIKTLALSKVVTVQGIINDLKGSDYFLANTKLHFRACVNSALINQDNTCLISKETAQLLEVSIGDTLRLAPINHGVI